MQQPRETDRIKCLECGRWFRALPHHLIRSHGLSDEDYRFKFGIPVAIPLVCIEWSENQTRKNVERDSRKTLAKQGAKKGYKQRRSVVARQAGHYRTLATAGCAAAAKVDRLRERLLKLEPYPVSVCEASTRLDCTLSAAYTFLSFCVRSARLARIKRGLYGPLESHNAD
jgi:hypothetical protein